MPFRQADTISCLAARSALSRCTRSRILLLRSQSAKHSHTSLRSQTANQSRAILWRSEARQDLGSVDLSTSIQIRVRRCLARAQSTVANFANTDMPNASMTHNPYKLRMVPYPIADPYGSKDIPLAPAQLKATRSIAHKSVTRTNGTTKVFDVRRPTRYSLNTRSAKYLQFKSSRNCLSKQDCRFPDYLLVLS